MCYAREGYSAFRPKMLSFFFFDRGELLKKLAKMSGGRHFDPITDGDFANGLP